MGRIEFSDLNFDYERALVGMALISMRAKWRSSLSAWRSVEKKFLTGSGIVRDACYALPLLHRERQFQGDDRAG
jgi:hypothetical protein